MLAAAMLHHFSKTVPLNSLAFSNAQVLLKAKADAPHHELYQIHRGWGMRNTENYERQV